MIISSVQPWLLFLKRIVLFVVLANFMVSCVKREGLQFIGNSAAMANKSIKLRQYKSQVFELRFNSQGIVDTTMILPSGYYVVSLDIPRTVYLSPKYKVGLDYIGGELTFTPHGDGAQINKYLKSKISLDDRLPEKEKRYALNEKEFLRVLTKTSNEMADYLNAVKTSDTTFINSEKRHLYYEMMNEMMTYEEEHKYLVEQANFRLSDSIKEVLNSINYDLNQDYINFTVYRKLVRNHFIDLHQLKVNPDTIDHLIENVRALKSDIIKNDLISRLRYRMTPNYKRLSSIYDAIQEFVIDPESKKQLIDKYTILSKLRKGSLSPMFEFKDVNGTIFFLENLKGKPTYIDVWATWCKPCVEEFDNLKELHDTYGDKIHFVSLSVDKKRDSLKWREMIKKNKLKGTHVLADDDFDTEFVKSFAIEGIPRFILLDDQLKIMNADAPRPSDPKIIAMFESIMN